MVDGAGVCTKCNANYVLFKYVENANDVVECRSAHQYLVDNCSTLVLADAGATRLIKDATCSACDKNTFPVDYNDAYACISDDNLKDKDIDITTQI